MNYIKWTEKQYKAIKKARRVTNNSRRINRKK